MDPEPSKIVDFQVLLRQSLYQFPFKFDCRHDKIASMRYQLRLWLLKQLTSDYSSYLFGDEPIEKRCFLPPNKWYPAHACTSYSHNGRPCARKLERGEPTHRCLTCGLDDTCVLCKYCFNPADHEGHNVFVKISSRDDGGICDCGDHEAWTREVHCLADCGPQDTRPLPEDFRQKASAVLDVMFDYVVDVLEGASLATQTAKSETALWKLSEAAELLPDSYHSPPRNSSEKDYKKWCLLVWDDDKKSETDLRSSLRLATERSDDFVKMIAKRIQISGRATVAVSNSLPEMIMTRKKLKHFLTSIRSSEDVMREEMAFEIINLALDLCHCPIYNAEPTALMKLVGEALLKDWLVGAKVRDPILSDILMRHRPDNNRVLYAMTDLQDVSQSLPDEDYHRYLREEMGDEGEELGSNFSSESDEELFGPRNIFGWRAQDLSEYLQREAQTVIRSWPVEKRNARVKFLIFFDVRLFKSMRQKLTDLYVAALVSNIKLKMQVAAVYADVYPLLVEHYIHIDHDPDLSVTTALSTQLFTTPSIATTLMETDAFEVYMKMLYKLFAKDGRLNPKVFRNRKLGQVFHAFGYLLCRNTKKELVGSHPRRLAYTAGFLSIFQGLAPMQRQSEQHVEYENERWVYCYAIMPFALQLARNVSFGIEVGVKNDANRMIQGMKVISKAIIQWQRTINEDISPKNVEYAVSYGRFSDKTFHIKGINTLVDPLSLLHPVHCFFSWLIEFSTINDVEQLRRAFSVERADDCTFFDAPISTLAVLSQISVGYWVRNGYAMKIQLQCYRDATLRNLSYSRDIFLIQVALCILDPSAVFTHVIHRFGLHDWPSSTVGDEQQAYYMLDELLHCLTFLLCDRMKFQNLTGVDFKRATLFKEILQAIGFETLRYSELTKLVPESMVVDEHFDMVLAECANFTPPKGAHSEGMYTLKSQFHKDFDPHYTHYTVARTEEAEKATEEKLGKNHLPPLLPLQGAWANIGSFTRCAPFAFFMFNILEKLLHTEASQAKQTLGRLLHLFLMAAKHDLSSPGTNSKDYVHYEGCFDTFAEMIMSPSHGINSFGNNSENKSILGSLVKALQCRKFATIHPRIQQLLMMLHQKDPSVEIPSSTSADLQDEEAIEQKKRKEKGKAMQKKVLDDFMRQQQSFLEMHSMEEGDSDAENASMVDDESCDGYKFPTYCVLCRMPDDEESIYGVLTYTTLIRTMRNLPMSDSYWVKQAFSEDCSLDIEHPLPQPTDSNWNESISNEDHDSVAWGPAFPKECLHDTSIVQGCGHGVHYSCFTTFLRNQRRERVPTRFTPENFADGEFLCPLCRGLNNSFMPVLWASNNESPESFLKEPENSVQDIKDAIEGTGFSGNSNVLVENSLAKLHPRFVSAIQQHNFRNTFHRNVRDVLLEQMLRIKRMSTRTSELDKTYGLHLIYRTLACTISQVEVALRGQAHSTPFGGLILDQLPSRTVQFLRVFANYIHTLTGFIMSSFIQLRNESEIPENIQISPVETLTKLVEMLYFGIPLNSVAPITVFRQAVITEIDRVFVNVAKMNTSEMTFNNDVSPDIASALSIWTPGQDPKKVFSILEHHITAILRRYAILVFSLCGKYDADDYVGLMSQPEYDRLLIYLRLPKLQEIILNLGNVHTPEGYIQSLFIEKGYVKYPNGFESISYPAVYRLIPLPERLDAMFNIKGRKIPLEPTVCLLCGHMCCIQSTEPGPLDIGPCNEHMARCGVSQGLYLLPRRNFVLLLLPPGRGTFIPAPYLDIHGEIDENMRRGRPHYLQPIRCEMLTRETWLWNNLPNLVARKLDQNQDNGGWETL